MRHELGIALGLGQGSIGGELVDEARQGDQERERHHGRDRSSDEYEADPHVSGATSFTPTPRRVWR